MTWLPPTSGTGSGENVGRLFTLGKKYKAGDVLLDPGTGDWFEQLADGAFGYPSHDIIDQVDYRLISEPQQLEVDLYTIGSTSLSLNITTSDAGSYEVDWEDNGNYVSENSGLSGTHSYGSAYTGNVKVRFSLGQYPVGFDLSNSLLHIAEDSFKKLNRYNTVTNFKVHGSVADQVKLSNVLHDGSRIASLFIQNPSIGLGDEEWGQYINKAEQLNYLYLYVVHSKAEQGSLNLDNVRLSEPLGSIYCDISGVVVTGSLSDFITHHDTDYFAFLTHADSNISVDTPMEFRSEMERVNINMLHTTQKIDKVLEALATRSNPTWVGSKQVVLSSPNNAIPSATGLGHKATIEAQTGFPEVTVNT